MFNASDNFFNDFTDNGFNETETSIDIAKDALKASSDGPGRDLIPVRMKRKCSNIFSIHFYILVSFMRESGVYPFSCKQTILTPIPKDGRKADTTNYSLIASLSLSKLPLAIERIIHSFV